MEGGDVGRRVVKVREDHLIRIAGGQGTGALHRAFGLVDILTESLTSQARSGNPLELLAPRARAVVTLLGSGMDATTVAKLLSISRETLYQDRRRAWRALAPVIPGRLLSEYEAHTAPWTAWRGAVASAGERDEALD